MKINKKRVWDWCKRVGGVVLTAIVAPYVTVRFGPEWGAVVGALGASATHQARRFGDGARLNRRSPPPTPTTESTP